MALPIVRIAPLIAPITPRLPTAPQNYDREAQENLLGTLRLYFNTIDNFCQPFSGNSGGAFLQFPYGAFSSDQDQTITADTATLMTLNTTDFSNNVSISSSKITVATAGLYNLQFSAQFQNTDNQIQDISIWLRQNGTDIPGSTGYVSIPAHKSASVGQEAHQITGWNYYVRMLANEYVEIWWSATNASVSIQHYPAPTGPVRPSTQSVVATLSFVSALPP
jgi:hypothetical protein